MSPPNSAIMPGPAGYLPPQAVPMGHMSPMVMQPTPEHLGHVSAVLWMTAAHNAPFMPAPAAPTAGHYMWGPDMEPGHEEAHSPVKKKGKKTQTSGSSVRTCFDFISFQVADIYLAIARVPREAHTNHREDH